MKKIIIACITSLLFMMNANAQVSMGISGTALYYDASGEETVKSSNTKNSKSDSGVVPMASLFIEKELDTGITVGLDVVPYGAKVADFNNARTDTDTDDASDTAGNNKGDVNFKNLVTLYASKDLANGMFAKFGVSRMTVETDETVATGSTYGDENIMGIMIGLGAQRDLNDGAFMRVEGQVSRFQGATFNGSTDSDSVKNKIDLDDFTTAGIKFSIGKSF
ncbi:hypothetical protein OAR46_00980 [Candidatus Pelagibacter sp.]|nr:hypothetical protein [Candidatus Pelagibacter sp.]